MSMAMALGQETDSIVVKKVFGGYQFSQNGTNLSMKGLVRAVELNELAYKNAKSARAMNISASIFGCAGGFLVGWYLGYLIAGREPDWIMTGVGAGLIVVIGIPLTVASSHRAKKAVDLYNNSLSQRESSYKTLNISFAENGVGVTLIF